MTKVISLSNEAYKALKKIKRKNESFSDVILRLINEAAPKPLSEFIGKWVGNDIEPIFQQVLREREKISSREAAI
ncbi:MAG: antitoxin VapB family protein [Candidatus Methanomethylicia archaeon]